MLSIKFSAEELKNFPRTKLEAKEVGSKYFFTNNPCKRGHLSPRLTKAGACTECRKENTRIAAEKRRRASGQKKLEDVLVKPLEKGARFENLVAMGSLVREKMGKRFATCHVVRCDCGKIYNLRAENWGITPRCWDCTAGDKELQKYRRDQRVKKSNLALNSHTLEYRLWNAARKRARKKNLEFNLKFSEVDIPDRCPILGIELHKTVKARKKSQTAEDNSPSIDRIDSSKGYVAGNIEIISWRANNLKNDGTADEHEKIADFLENVETGNYIPYRGPNYNLKLDNFYEIAKLEWTLEELKQLPSSRGRALELGSRFYFTKLCKHKHLCPRKLDGKCRTCVNEREVRRKERLGRSQGVGRGMDLAEIRKDPNNYLTFQEAVSQSKKYYVSNEECSKGHKDVCVIYERNGTKFKQCKICSQERSKARNQKRKKLKSGGIKSHNLTHSTAGFLYGVAKARAKVRNKIFELKVEDILIPKFCPVLGIELDLVYGSVEETHADRSRKVSLDRLDSNLGYTKDNVVCMSYRANILKGDGTANEHRLIAQFIRQKQS